MSERAAPFFCPYCGDEDLRPGEQGHGAWECAACGRAFQLKFLGLLAPGGTGRPAAPAGTRSTDDGHGTGSTTGRERT